MLDLENKTVWQQACGDRDRDYHKVCLRWDVILYGPGKWGKIPENLQAYKDNETSRRITNLKKFAYEIDEGDLVVLKIGTDTVYGVGVVCGEYEWLDIFGDVDGWDVQHTRRVKWLKKFNDDPREFPTYTLKRGTTKELTSEKVLKWIKSLDIAQTEYERPLKELPRENIERVGSEKISEFLFDRGVASNSINKLIDEIDELERII